MKKLSFKAEEIDNRLTTVELLRLAQETLQLGVDSAQNMADTAKSTADTAKSAAQTAQATAKTADLTAKTAQATAQTAQYTAEVASSTAKTAKATADVAKSAAEAAAATANAAAKAADVAELTSVVGEHTANIASLSSDIAAANKTIAENQQAIAEELSSLAGDVVHTGKYTADVAESSAKISELQAQVITLNAEVLEETGKVAKNTADVAQAAADITKVQAEVTTLTATVATNTANVATITADVATNTANVATNTANVAQAAADITKVQAEVTALTATVADEAAKAAAATAKVGEDVAKVGQDVASLGTDVAGIGTEVANQAKTMAELATELSDLASEVFGETEGTTDNLESIRSLVAKAQQSADNATDLANNAQGKADTAETNAQKGIADAKTADDHAAAAQSAADQAASAASVADAKAVAAQKSADDAQASANLADAKAVEAQSAATTAQSAADQAAAAAKTADDKAVAAQGAASNAATAAKNADDKAAEAKNAAAIADGLAKDAGTAAAGAKQAADDAEAHAKEIEGHVETIAGQVVVIDGLAKQAAEEATAATAASAEAKTKAQEAHDFASAAKTSAENASSSATEALKNANSAVESAGKAQESAATAVENAAAAIESANAAISAAEEAGEAAELADEAAAKAQAAADAAKATADRADEHSSSADWISSLGITAQKIEITNESKAPLFIADASEDAQYPVLIGGFGVNDHALYNGLNITKFDDIVADGKTGIYIGTDGIKVGSKFFVKPDGTVSASNFTLSDSEINRLKLTIKSIDYAVSNVGTAAPSSGWQGTVPTANPGQYIWTRTTYIDSDSDDTNNPCSYQVYKQPEDGQDGIDGKDGVNGKDGKDGVSATTCWISTPCSVHKGQNHGQNIIVTGMKKVGDSLEEIDTSSYLWWKYSTGSDWKLAAARYRISFNFPSEVPDADIFIIATHHSDFNPNATGVDVSTDSNIYDRETIPFSPINSPILNLTNDSASIAYKADGSKVTDSDTVSTTAELWVNGSKLAAGMDYVWTLNNCKTSDGKTSVSSVETITIKTLSANTATATCTATYESKTYSKVFTITKQLQGVQGIQGIQGIQGEKGADGYTPVKGVDYFDGEDGSDGTDGKSISTITYYYLTSSSGYSTKPTSSTISNWSTTQPLPTTAKPYVFASTITSTDGVLSYSTATTPVKVNSVDGLTSILSDGGINILTKVNNEYCLNADRINGAVGSGVTIGGFKINSTTLKDENNNLILNGSTGEITAKSGTIGGFTLNPNEFKTTRTDTSTGSSFTATDVLITNADQTHASKVAGTSLNSWRLLVGSNFGVDKTGRLFASNGNFSGTVNADGGSLNNIESIAADTISSSDLSAQILEAENATFNKANIAGISLVADTTADPTVIKEVTFKYSGASVSYNNGSWIFKIIFKGTVSGSEVTFAGQQDTGAKLQWASFTSSADRKVGSGSQQSTQKITAKVYFNKAVIRTAQGRAEIVLTASAGVDGTTSSTTWSLNEVSILNPSGTQIGASGTWKKSGITIKNTISNSVLKFGGGLIPSKTDSTQNLGSTANPWGSVYGTNMYASAFYASSDKRLKDNIKEYTPQKSILDLPIVEFDFKNTNIHQIGCLAQDLQEICPELVTTNNDGYLSISENKLVYLLLDELKKLNSRIIKLEHELKIERADNKC